MEEQETTVKVLGYDIADGLGGLVELHCEETKGDEKCEVLN